MAFYPKDHSASVNRLRAIMGPGQVDQQFRQAIQFAWMMLPAERRTSTELERVIRQIVDLALKDFREDAETFDQGGERLRSATSEP